MWINIWYNLIGDFMSEEYEYSFKVNDITSFIDYCVNNGYKLIDQYDQVRTLYKNGGKVMARITKNIFSDKTIEILDFKDDNLSDKSLKIRRESKQLIIDDKNRDFVYSLFEILDLKEAKKLIRKRYIYGLSDVTFELDMYKEPPMNVLAFEGDKFATDKTYFELKDMIEKYAIKE